LPAVDAKFQVTDRFFDVFEAEGFMDEKTVLKYHQEPRPGKIEVVPTKPCLTQTDLSIAYSPGVAIPCLKIQENKDLSFEYTSRGNLIGVVTNGTAVLGLGNIGARASKPVMEGKGVLFKRFGGIDVFDIEVNTTDPKQFVEIVANLEPTFGGINLEDIKAPDCFYIEQELRKRMSIPVFHDDQHGTAIISAAALINAVELAGKAFESLRIVVNGAGSAGIACAKIYLGLGVKKENLILADSRGVIYEGRTEGMNPFKDQFAVATELRTLEQAAEGTDVLVGLSVKGAFTETMLKSMAANPIVFALANPDPEITYDEAKQVRPDAIMATGRSDYPNQVNNVLGFPFIFRGALDVGAREINEEMKIAAVTALAKLAREDVPDSVIRAYGGKPIVFGPDYIIPKPLDHRVLLTLPPAIAKAAVETGVARKPYPGDTEYLHQLEARLGPEREIMREMITRAQADRKRIVFPEGEHPTILRAAHAVAAEGIAQPVILGDPTIIQAIAKEAHISLDGIEVVQPKRSEHFEGFIEKLYQRRGRKGWTRNECARQLRSPYVFGAMMVLEGLVDGQVHGMIPYYADSIRPVLQVISRRPGIRRVSGVTLMVFPDRTILFADTTVNIQPSAEDLAEIAILASEMAEFFGLSPRIAMVSFSNFGSTRHRDAKRVSDAVKLVKQKRPELTIDGEMQADTAVSAKLLAETYPFNELGGPANVLVFPGLASGNIAYKLLSELSGAQTVGPLLMGIDKPFNVLQHGCDMESVVNVAAITAVQAQELARKRS
jgi:malate dehydrogenase (oxaloacetate-decarboxylating)(NADP+)